MSVVDESIRVGKLSSLPFFLAADLQTHSWEIIIGEQKTNLNCRGAIPYKLSAKNKCGPGQPPGPHWFGGTFCDPFPRTRHGGSSSFTDAPRSAGYDALGRSPLAKSPS